MSKLKRCNAIHNWDFLDKFYGYEVKGFVVKYEEFERTFCRCGETMNGFVEKCPKCGNFTFITKKNAAPTYQNNVRINFNSGEVVDKKIVMKNLVDSSTGERTLSIIEESFCLDDTGVGAGFIRIVGEEDKLIEIGKDFIEMEDFSDVAQAISKYPSIEKYFEDNAEFIVEANKDLLALVPTNEDDAINHRGYSWYYKDEEEGRKIAFSLPMRLCFALRFKKCYEEVLKDEDLKRHPFILKALISDIFDESAIRCHEPFNRPVKSSFYKLLNEKLCSKLTASKYQRALPLIEMSAKELNSLEDAIMHRINWRTYSEIGYYLEQLDEKETGFEDVISHYVSNGMILWKDGFDALKELKDLKDTYYREYLKFFNIYLKENVAIRKTEIVKAFREQIDLMEEKNIPVKEENFKTRTFNFLINQKCLAEAYRMPQGKVDLFLDMFEINPIEALGLLSNRRKLTKKEQDKFLEIMFKN